MARRLVAVVAALGLIVSASTGSSSQAAPRGACGLPDATTVWVDYGEGSLTPDVCAVFTRP